MTFLLGAYFSIFCLDFINSLILSIKLSGNAKKLNITVDFEKYKILQIKDVKSSRINAMVENLKKSTQPLNDKISKMSHEIKRHMYIGNKIPEKSSAEKDETPRTKSRENSEKF